MALAESAGAPWNGSAKSYSGISSVTSASFTPAANSLLCLIAAVGNSNAVSSTGFTVTGTGFFSGATWTPLVVLSSPAADGMGGIWVLDAGASPSAGTVTVAVNGTPPVAIATIVRQFAGAAPAASQSGVTNTASGTLASASLTPGTTGSQVVASYGSNNGILTLTPNAATTVYGTGQDTLNGSTFDALEASALSAGGTPVTLGFTQSAKSGTGFALAEILPAAGTPPAPAVIQAAVLPRRPAPRRPSSVLAAPGAVCVTGADSASAAEAGSLPGTVLDEAGADIQDEGGANVLEEGDGTTPSGADSGHAAEAVSVAGWIPPVLVRGRMPDAPSRRARPASGIAAVFTPPSGTAVSSADSGHASEAAYGFGGDWGHAAEASSVAGGTTPHGADSGHGADVPLTYHRSGADSGHAAETAGRPVSSSDTGHAAEAGAVTDPRGAPFTIPSLLFGSQIGAWDMNGGTAVSNSTAIANVEAARIQVIRWQMWHTPAALGGTQLTADFLAGVNGIIALGAIPLIGFPPIVTAQFPGGADPWTLAWQKWILDQCVPLGVTLYEMGNEPNNYGGLTGQQYHDQLWYPNVPALKAYARSTYGTEIYVGGPAWSSSATADLTQLETWLADCKADYLANGGDRDYLPDFVSTHSYLTPAENTSEAVAQQAIDAFGTFYDSLRTYINAEFAGLYDRGYPVAREMLIADSEYNDTVDQSSTINAVQAWTDFYFTAMHAMASAAAPDGSQRLWLAVQFTICSENGAMDMLNADGTAKPEYISFRALSAPVSPAVLVRGPQPPAPSRRARPASRIIFRSPVPVSSADSGHAAEAGSTGGTSPHSADTALAAESAFYYIAGADAGHGAEGARMAVSAADSGHPADRALTAWPGGRDAGKAADGPHSAGLNPSADAGHAAEASKPFPFSSADSGHGTDAVHEIGIWTYLPAGVRLLVPYRHDPAAAARLERAVRTLAEGLAAEGSFARVTRHLRSADSACCSERGVAAGG